MRLHGTGLSLNSDRSDFRQVQQPRREILRPGPEISSLYAFGSAIYLLEKTHRFIPKPGTKHLVPVSCKQLQKFHTGRGSYRSEFVPVSCKPPLATPLSSISISLSFLFLLINIVPYFVKLPLRKFKSC